MNETFQCGDASALVAYLYDECAPGEQELIAAHLSECATCASEIGALRSTRRTLAAWTPPELELGFQITRANAEAPAKVLTPTIAWWRAPLPAWAQAAAALVIFAAGLSMGLTRSGATETSARSGSTPSATVATPSSNELAQLEQRLRAEMSQLKPANAAPVSNLAAAPGRGSDDALMQQVKTLLEQSEERQRRDFTLRMVDMASNFETQRRVDLASVRQSFGQLQGAVRTEIGQQREVNERVNSLLVNVSERSR